jgi:diguanylate cyclase (GGDEF)-like protein
MSSALKSQQERLLALIDVDALTGLDNHRRFQERLAQEAQRSIQLKQPLSIILIDVDQFGEYNKCYGHSQGDSALKGIADVLKAALPQAAIPARYGGEEFAVLLPLQSLDEAVAVAEEIRGRLRFAVDLPSIYGRPGEPLTVSIGCAERGPSITQAESLVLAAELAVSRAKSLGRNQVCRFDNVEGYEEDSDPYHLHRFLKDSSLATIQALAAAVDAKDSYTRGHSRRVAEYASSLAKYIGVSQAEQELIYTTGTLHDVGKIGVPDSILNKPGRLTDDERIIMETHPALGEVIVRKAPALAAALPGVRHHHERWDGKGYPDGLSGEEIPRLARFLAVADTFDAMTSDRPYRKGLPHEVALGEISKGAGTQFDPELAEAFVRWVQIADGGLPLAA